MIRRKFRSTLWKVEYLYKKEVKEIEVTIPTAQIYQRRKKFEEVLHKFSNLKYDYLINYTKIKTTSVTFEMSDADFIKYGKTRKEGQDEVDKQIKKGDN